MKYTDKAMQNPNILANSHFIEDALADVEKSIIKIENKHNVKLIGDRMDFTKARKDWRHLTQGQVVFAVSLWKKGISTRYPD